MKVIKYLVLCLSIYCFLPSSVAYASEKSHMDAAKELMEMSNFDKIVENMQTSFLQMILGNMLKNEPCLETAKKPLLDLAMQHVRKMIDIDKTKYEIQKLYTEEFTENELRELIAFNKTPTGKKVIEKMPIIMEKAGQVGLKQVEKNQTSEVVKKMESDIQHIIDNIDPKTLSPECKKRLQEEKEAVQKTK